VTVGAGAVHHRSCPIALNRAWCYISLMITSEQVRAARALLRIEQDDLARRAHISAATIRRLEAFNGIQRVSPGTVKEVQRALEEAGVEFIDDGVRRRPARDRARADEVFADIMAIAKNGAARPKIDPGFSEADLYGDDGLPS
jgi:transcriptional regulator with XRE-family HTH domain